VIARASWLPLLLLAGCSCEASTGRPPPGGFESPSIALCTAGTTAASVRTRSGGRLELEVLDACGRVLRSCAPPDVFAANAVASVRVAGSEILAEGCVLAASDATTLRARFRVRRDGAMEAMPEEWDARLIGCSDAEPPDASCPADGGADADTATDAGTGADAASDTDAATATDAGTDAATATDSGPDAGSG
jgi:hypothetical protein